MIILPFFLGGGGGGVGLLLVDTTDQCSLDFGAVELIQQARSKRPLATQTVSVPS
jgi:hypothetical protein